MTHPKYMAVPTILINEPYQLSFRYPDWANGNEPTTRTYILGKTKDGKIGHLTYLGDIENRKKGRNIYSPEDTAKKMTHVIMYEDEGAFGSAGLLHNGNHQKIRLRGFADAAEKHNYHIRYTELISWYFKCFQEQEEAYGKDVGWWG